LGRDRNRQVHVDPWFTRAWLRVEKPREETSAKEVGRRLTYRKISLPSPPACGGQVSVVATELAVAGLGSRFGLALSWARRLA